MRVRRVVLRLRLLLPFLTVPLLAVLGGASDRVAAPPRDEVPEWSVREAWRVGDADAEEEIHFALPVDAAVGPEGMVAVADANFPGGLLFDERGRLVERIDASGSLSVRAVAGDRAWATQRLDDGRFRLLRVRARGEESGG